MISKSEKAGMETDETFSSVADIATRGTAASRPADAAANGMVELARYAELGRACESNGLGWFNEAGEMRFQPPAEVIAEGAVAAWSDRAGETARALAWALAEIDGRTRYARKDERDRCHQRAHAALNAALNPGEPS